NVSDWCSEAASPPPTIVTRSFAPTVPGSAASPMPTDGPTCNMPRASRMSQSACLDRRKAEQEFGLMEEEMNRRIGSRMGSDGVPVGRSIATPVQDTRRAEIVVPPAEVIPIVFVPGIMGSNLRNRESGESVWNASTVLTLAWQWAFRSAKTRQAKLDPAAVEVDPDGKLPKVGRYAGDDGQSVRLGVEQLRERGWGGVSRAGYGDFMAWLEPALNSGAANPWDGLAG